MKIRVAKTIALIAAVMLAVAAAEAAGLAQCAMCRASLAGSNNEFFIKNFNIGVLVLLTPPVAIFCSIFMILKRHGGSGGSDSENRQEPDDRAL